MFLILPFFCFDRLYAVVLMIPAMMDHDVRARIHVSGSIVLRI